MANRGRPKKIKEAELKEVSPTNEPTIATPTPIPAIINEEKEKRRKMLLELQATCARERITGLSDIERKLEELEKM